MRVRECADQILLHGGQAAAHEGKHPLHALLPELHATEESFHNDQIKEGKIRLSYKATIAALLIQLYRDEPILQEPYRMLQAITEMDALLTNWRYRHAQMVMRMLGRKTGTGGSSGHEYLMETVKKHQIFDSQNNLLRLH